MPRELRRNAPEQVSRRRWGLLPEQRQDHPQLQPPELESPGRLRAWLRAAGRALPPKRPELPGKAIPGEMRQPPQSQRAGPLLPLSTTSVLPAARQTTSEQPVPAQPGQPPGARQGRRPLKLDPHVPTMTLWTESHQQQQHQVLTPPRAQPKGRSWRPHRQEKPPRKLPVQRHY